MEMNLEERFNKNGLYHFSNSQLQKPVANWFYDYIYLSPEERRKIIVGENAALGTSAHSGIQNVLCNGVEIEQAIDDAVMEFEFHPANHSEEKRVKFREVLPDMIHTGVNLMAEDFTGAEEERKIELRLEGVILPVIGFVDLFAEGKFAEIKTKAPRMGAPRKDGTRGWSKGSLPKQPDFSHVQQAAIYNLATGAEPNIVYVSSTDGIIFTPQNCEQLSDNYLSYAIDEVRRKCILRQNLLAISDDPKTLAGILEPDFGSFYWANEQIEEAKKLWKI